MNTQSGGACLMLPLLFLTECMSQWNSPPATGTDRSDSWATEKQVLQALKSQSSREDGGRYNQ